MAKIELRWMKNYIEVSLTLTMTIHNGDVTMTSSLQMLMNDHTLLRIAWKEKLASL